MCIVEVKFWTNFVSDQFFFLTNKTEEKKTLSEISLFMQNFTVFKLFV